MRQAREAARVLKDINFAVVYTSDLGRALQTAQIITDGRTMPLIEEPRIRERNFGVLEGLNLEEIEKQHPEYYQKFLSRTQDCDFSGGKTGFEVTARILSAFNDIANRHPGERVMLITHGGVISRFFRYTLQLNNNSHRPYSVSNCSINIFTYTEEQWLLRTWGWQPF